MSAVVKSCARWVVNLWRQLRVGGLWQSHRPHLRGVRHCDSASSVTSTLVLGRDTMAHKKFTLRLIVNDSLQLTQKAFWFPHSLLDKTSLDYSRMRHMRHGALFPKRRTHLNNGSSIKSRCAKPSFVICLCSTVSNVVGHSMMVLYISSM